MKEHILDRAEAMHERLGTAGFILSIIALCLALTGGAYAAAGLNGKQKKEVEKIAKKSGKPGPAGTAGTNGTNGKDGTNGTNGSDGADGTSATTESFAGINGTCTAGGVTVKSASPDVNVCNGKNGTNGKDGSDGVACPGGSCTLPSGATLTGFYAESEKGAGFMSTPISFPLTLSFDPITHFVTGAEAPTTDCPGEAGNPKAAAGHFCMYEVLAVNVNLPPALLSAAPKMGMAASFFTTVEADQAIVNGTWAVTAP